MAPVLLDGRYRLEGIIGEGGMATVYQAWDERLDRRVAVKLLRPQTTLSEAEAEDFLREARTVARLNHPNVVAVHDAGVADGRPYLVMEFLPGQTLRQRLQAGPLPVTEALRIVRALAGALEAAHAQGILHLDVKPENVLFGEGHDPKLSDFGVSRSLDDVAAPDNGTILGTAAYIAPEVVAGQPPDGRADVYALGVVLYEMVTGQRPFPGGTPVEQAAQRMVTQPILPHLLNPSVPPRLGGILLRALARDPAERYASPTVLCTALEEYENRAEQRTMAISPVKPPALPASRATAPAPIAQRPAAPGPVVPHARVFEAPSRSRAAAPPQKRGCLWLSLWLLVVLVLSGVLGVVLASTVLPDLAGWVTRAGPPL
ncbi:MAG TPA: protein kinase, partial [Ardenticatenaceae bacterium]|nr:protein kinase [Ardenticatenaceae bacterium]